MVSLNILGLATRLQMCGFADDVRSVWSDRQILVLASSGEGKPLALTEAMLCGRPAVVTDVGGNVELVTDCVTGLSHRVQRSSVFGRRWSDPGSDGNPGKRWVLVPTIA